MEKTNDTKNNKIELLAPVGGTEHLRAAVQAGADAVYLGGKLFNARINANNFDGEEMRYAVDYAHLRGVKVFVTMNTLLRDEDLSPALRYAAELYEMGVDALIVQDLGLAMLIREAMPEFPLHLSTQGTVYDADGVRAAAELGFERVVLARELTLDEISDCCKVGPEIEVFVHGALCVCYSGQCNMSRLSGGRSGNRGLCAQPCRLPYTDESGRCKHFLSPKDSCAIDMLGALIEAGVKSFKIEGRMKSPEYVAIVTKVYRKYIDQYLKCGYIRVEDSDREALLQAFNRGGFTDGYLTGKKGERMMAPDIPKHQGILIGKAIRNAYRDLVEIELGEGAVLNIGDGVEIHNRELSGNVVTYIKPAKDQAGTNGRRLIIGDIHGKFKGGEEVWKITSRELNESVQSLYKTPKDGNDIGKRRYPIDMDVKLHVGEPANMILSAVLDIPYHGDDGDSDKTCTGVINTYDDIIPELPQKRALEHDRIREQLTKCGDFPLEVTEFTLDADENLTLPISALNRMRRECMAGLSESIIAAYRRERVDDGRCIKGLNTLSEPGINFDDTSIAHAYKVSSNSKYGAFNSLLIGETGSKKGKRLLLVPAEEFKKALMDILGKDSSFSGIACYLSRVSKGRLNEWTYSHLEKLREISEITGHPIFAGNLGQLYYLREAGIPVIADYGLNATNRASLSALSNFGAKSVIEALEYRDDISGLQPLMITEQPLMSEGSRLQSHRREERGEKPMTVIRSPLGDKTYILG